jgi:hypothetical protein
MKMEGSERPAHLSSHSYSELRATPFGKRFTSLQLAKRLRWILAAILLILTAPLLLLFGDVAQHHLNGTRNGLYVDPLITQKTATTIHRDRTFNARLPGPVYAQPLYATNGPSFAQNSL